MIYPGHELGGGEIIVRVLRGGGGGVQNPGACDFRKRANPPPPLVNFDRSLIVKRKTIQNIFSRISNLCTSNKGAIMIDHSISWLIMTFHD